MLQDLQSHGLAAALRLSPGSQTVVLHHFADKCHLYPQFSDQGSIRAIGKGFYASPELYFVFIHIETLALVRTEREWNCKK